MEGTIQRWSAKRKVELLLALIKGEKKLVDACREYDLKQSEVEGWMDSFLKSGERGLKANAEDEVAVREKEIKVRIPTIPNTVSEASRSVIPSEADHLVRAMASTVRVGA